MQVLTVQALTQLLSLRDPMSLVFLDGFEAAEGCVGVSVEGNDVILRIEHGDRDMAIETPQGMYRFNSHLLEWELA